MRRLVYLTKLTKRGGSDKLLTIPGLTTVPGEFAFSKDEKGRLQAELTSTGPYGMLIP